jgi:hypothetical protein
MHMPNRDIYFPAVVLAMGGRLMDRNVSRVPPPTSKSDDVTKDSEGIAKGDMEVFSPVRSECQAFASAKTVAKAQGGNVSNKVIVVLNPRVLVMLGKYWLNDRPMR